MSPVLGHGAAATAAAAALVPVGATFGLIGDGLEAQAAGVGGGPSNPVHQFMRLIGGRLQPVIQPLFALSGTTIARDITTNRAWINPYAINALLAQVPDVFICGTFGANDNILSTDPGASPGDGTTTNIYLQDWYDAVKAAHTGFVAYNGKIFVVSTTAPSTKVGEATYRTTVWNAQKAFVAALKVGDSRVVLADTTDQPDATQLSIDSGSSYVHFDERGGYHQGLAFFTALDPLIVAATDDQIAAMFAAGTYPLMSGATLETDEALVGTAGTVTGPGITGTIATSKAVANTTGATGITVSQVATSGGRTKTVVDMSAATATTGDGKIMISDKSNVVATGSTPGQPIHNGAIFRASANVFRNFGADWSGGNFGIWGAGGTALVDNTRDGADETHALSKLIFTGTMQTAPFGGTIPFAAKRDWAIFIKSGKTLSGTLEMERPFLWKPTNRTAAAPVYIGGVANSVGGLLLSTNWHVRPTGTISAAAGGTIRVEPGTWNLFGLTEADFASRRIYKGVVGNTGVGTGTLIATLSGSTWTNVFGAAAVTTGDKLFVEVDCNNGVGGTVTARSSAADVVTAT